MHSSILLVLSLVSLNIDTVSPSPYCPLNTIIKLSEYKYKSVDECLDLEEPDWYGLPIPTTDDGFHELCCKKRFCEATHIRYFWCFIRPRVG